MLLLAPQRSDIRPDLQKDDNRFEGSDIVTAQRTMVRHLQGLTLPLDIHSKAWLVELAAQSVGQTTATLRLSELLHLRLLLIDAVDQVIG